MPTMDGRPVARMGVVDELLRVLPGGKLLNPSVPKMLLVGMDPSPVERYLPKGVQMCINPYIGYLLRFLPLPSHASPDTKGEGVGPL